MKFITTILGLYFMLMAIVPCQDNDLVADDAQTRTSVQSHSGKDDSLQDVCPPFCNCTCCSTPRTVPAQQIITIFSKTLTRTFPQPTIPATQQQALAIWQPPQLV